MRRGERNGSAPAAKKVFSAIDLFTAQEKKQPANQTSHFEQVSATLLKRGHNLTYAALFAFTIVLYARPSEFYPSPVTASLALALGIITLALFVPTQFGLEGTPTAPLREVHLVLLFALIALVSIPLAISPADAWHEFSGAFIRCVVIFIVMVNVVRTPSRLKALLLLTIVVSIWLSIGALNDYRLGLTTVEGYRVSGRGDGIFGNPNDMALHLVTVIPITIALLFATRRFLSRIVYAVSALVMIAAVILTFSRGGFLGLLAGSVFLAYKLGYRRRLTIAVAGVVLLLLLFILAPGNYPMRLASIFVPSLDPAGSAGARRELLFRSVMSAIRHPLLGLGMGNFHIVSIHEQVTHNGYTQVAAELGVAALVIYTMFIVTPLRKLGQIVSETRVAGRKSKYYYLAIGLQASLLAYMVSSFFASVAYLWYVYYLVAYAVCLRRLYEAETGNLVVVETKRQKKKKQKSVVAFIGERDVLTT
jgi:O-antigen ligase